MFVGDIVSEVLLDATSSEIVLFGGKFLVESLSFLVFLGKDIDRRSIGTVRQEFGEHGLNLADRSRCGKGVSTGREAVGRAAREHTGRCS